MFEIIMERKRKKKKENVVERTRPFGLGGPTISFNGVTLAFEFSNSKRGTRNYFS